jgi:ADP-heptose:LPS heptosyltransferase
MVLGPVEEEKWAGRGRELPPDLAVLRSLPLSALAGMLASAAAYVGNDSGVSHLSAAVGTPTTALFAAPNDRHFAPRGARVRIVCGDALEEIDVESVVEAVCRGH